MDRRQFLHGAGIGALLAACTRTAASAPTPEVLDDDDDPATCDETADSIEGPFYKPGAPSRSVLVRKDQRGERLVLSGTVRSTACAPLAGAILDIWHADARGAYDNDGWGLRGTLRTDARGRWQVTTIVPGRYLNGPRYRPMHIHAKVRARDHRPLTTQLYFAGDAYLEGDPFVVSSLIMAHHRRGGVRRAAFDFVLPPA